MAGMIPFNRRRNELSPHNIFNMMDDFFNDAWPVGIGRNLMNDTFKVDVQESDAAYTIEAEMPGINRDEINLSLDDDRLTVSVQRNEEVKNDKDNYIHRERKFSSMQRSIFLNGADYEGIDAKLENGVLSVVVPKRTKPDTSKQIEIK